MLSGIVITLADRCEVIALATGVKCTPSERHSSSGVLLHDCHAEVLCRRAARAWLLDRLSSEVQSTEPVIDGLPRVFRRSDDGRWAFGIGGALLHWYISTLPCTPPHARRADCQVVRHLRSSSATDLSTGRPGARLRELHSASFEGAKHLCGRVMPYCFARSQVRPCDGYTDALAAETLRRVSACRAQTRYAFGTVSGCKVRCSQHGLSRCMSLRL